MSCWYLFTLLGENHQQKEAQLLCGRLINPDALSAVRSTITNNAGDRRKRREQNWCAEKTLIS
jgi:hypothetical protein